MNSSHEQSNAARRLIFPGLVMLMVSVAGHLCAQQPEPPFEGPPIAQAPKPISYTITQTNAGEEAEKKRAEANPDKPKPADIWGHRIVQWKIVCSGTLTAVELTAKNGNTGAMWVVGGVEVVRAPGMITYFINRSIPGFDAYHLDFGRYGYPFTSWISLGNFDKKTSLQGKPALHFSGKIQEHTIDGAVVIVDVEAWIDFATRMPLYLKQGDNTYAFQYSPAPGSPLSLPGEAQAALGNEVARIRRLTGVPPGP